MSDWNFTDVLMKVARAVPDRVAVVYGDSELTYAELVARASALALHLSREGVVRGDRVAIDLPNIPQYLESFFAAQMIGAIPMNVNYRYGPEETAYLLKDSAASAIVFHQDYASTVYESVSQLGRSASISLLEVPDDSGDEQRKSPASRTAMLYEDAVRRSLQDLNTGSSAMDGSGLPPLAYMPSVPYIPSGDDIIIIYTGGTTGMPKGVMWRSDDLYVALWHISGRSGEPRDPVAYVESGRAAPSILAASPLMHGTALFTPLQPLAGGGRVVLLGKGGFDAEATWRAVSRYGVNMIQIVGDAFARPMLRYLEEYRDGLDLSQLRIIASSGMLWSSSVKNKLLNYIPGIVLIDSLGASEGLSGRDVTSRESLAEDRPVFKISDHVRVIDDEGDEIEPGSGEIGRLAVYGRVPLGYWGDAKKTKSVFHEVNGVRYSIPGDFATVEDDGTIQFIGRGSACINTGGEKVYPEEVEAVLRSHPSVEDCVVVGVPDERWGEAVTALIVPSGNPPESPSAGGGSAETASEDHAAIRGGINIDELYSYCHKRLSGYKVPKHFLQLQSLRRAPSGKADYKYLRSLAGELLADTSADRHGAGIR
jgi:fatty-acyl-CoA synthase